MSCSAHSNHSTINVSRNQRPFTSTPFSDNVSVSLGRVTTTLCTNFRTAFANGRFHIAHQLVGERLQRIKVDKLEELLASNMIGDMLEETKGVISIALVPVGSQTNSVK